MDNFLVAYIPDACAGFIVGMVFVLLKSVRKGRLTVVSEEWAVLGRVQLYMVFASRPY